MNLMILKHLLNREGLGGRLHHFEISLSVHVVSFTCFFHLFLVLVSRISRGVWTYHFSSLTYLRQTNSAVMLVLNIVGLNGDHHGRLASYPRARDDDLSRRE
jgi:hypothetical protein